MTIGPASDHRNREAGAPVYPVYSRRSRGLSVGINLFPGGKVCSFDCPYCEVFPFTPAPSFSTGNMKAALRSCLLEAGGLEVKDICFSGSGEPALSPFFTEAVEAAERIRGELAPRAKLVLITNGTGLLDRAVFAFLAEKTGRGVLEVWLKLDSGTEAWYAAINRSSLPYADIVSRIREFAVSGARFTVQTMLCTVNARLPSAGEEAAWIKLVTQLAAPGGMSGVQIYGKARPAPEDPLADAAPPEILEKRAALLRSAFADAGIAVPVDVFV